MYYNTDTTSVHPPGYYNRAAAYDTDLPLPPAHMMIYFLMMKTTRLHRMYYNTDTTSVHPPGYYIDSLRQETPSAQTLQHPLPADILGLVMSVEVGSVP